MAGDKIRLEGLPSHVRQALTSNKDAAVHAAQKTARYCNAPKDTRERELRIAAAMLETYGGGFQRGFRTVTAYLRAVASQTRQGTDDPVATEYAKLLENMAQSLEASLK